ncbi:MAG: hypothetical protein K0S53_2328 [Bacteroidetes bacterium]|jgi:hypothetical protein|nr:hypothetical protein [Bacteroidota bacterium]MDF2450577.1 hypothetical protein [Bacteroidota bacterium]
MLKKIRVCLAFLKLGERHGLIVQVTAHGYFFFLFTE